MKFFDLVPQDIFEKDIEQGYIRSSKHPTLPITIYKYSEKTAYEKHWTEATKICRGIILDDNMDIIARPYRKFWNYGETPILISSTDPVEVCDKIDGSLGIIFRTNSNMLPEVSTVGSFISEQAIFGTKLLHIMIETKMITIPDNFDEFTFLTEIVYPANRIVLDYAGESALYLLGAVHKEYGYYLGPNEAAGILGWSGKVAETFQFKSIDEVLAADLRPNAEGYVIRSGNRMTKLKYDSYIQIHRIVTNTNTKTVWQAFGVKALRDIGADNKLIGWTLNCSEQAAKDILGFDEMLDNVPDEFYDWVRSVANDLKKAFFDIQTDMFKTFNKHKTLHGDRRAFAKAVKDYEHKSALFNILDGQSNVPYILRQIKPKSEKPFRSEE